MHGLMCMRRFHVKIDRDTYQRPKMNGTGSKDRVKCSAHAHSYRCVIKTGEFSSSMVNESPNSVKHVMVNFLKYVLLHCL